jgi:hypothetical protein
VAYILTPTKIHLATAMGLGMKMSRTETGRVPHVLDLCQAGDEALTRAMAGLR